MTKILRPDCVLGSPVAYHSETLSKLDRKMPDVHTYNVNVTGHSDEALERPT